MPPRALRVARVALAFLGVFAFIFMCGSSMPRQHIAMETVNLAAAPEVVYKAVRDLETAATWRSDLQRVEIVETKGDRVVYREIGDGGVTTFQLTEDVPNERLVTEITDIGKAFSGRWVFQFAPAEGGGTRLTITEVGDVTNPVLRFFAGTFFGYEGAIRQYIRDLEGHLPRS
jgi:uncharacterized protein YndB with AHSA1/START domain